MTHTPDSLPPASANATATNHDIDAPAPEAAGREGNMGRNRPALRQAVVVLFGLVPLLALACGSDGKPSTEAVTTLGRVTPFKQGQPALVFVYTDG